MKWKRNSKCWISATKMKTKTNSKDNKYSRSHRSQEKWKKMNDLSYLWLKMDNNSDCKANQVIALLFIKAKPFLRMAYSSSKEFIFSLIVIAWNLYTLIFSLLTFYLFWPSISILHHFQIRFAPIIFTMI